MTRCLIQIFQHPTLSHISNTLSPSFQASLSIKSHQRIIITTSLLPPLSPTQKPLSILPPELYTDKVPFPYHRHHSFSMSEMQRQKPQHSISHNDPNKNTNPLARPAGPIAIAVQHAGACDHTLGHQFGVVHALAAGAAGVGALGEFVDHHALEDVGLVANEFCQQAGPYFCTKFWENRGGRT